MTFIDRKTTRKAQAARLTSKDRKGRPNGKYETPDRPGTYLSYSMTSSTGERPKTALEAALADAGIESKRNPRRKVKRAQNPVKREQKARTVDPAVAMRRIAEAAQREE